MIIKSHIRGGYRSAAEYLSEQGKNEKTRLVELSDSSAKNLDDAFHNMWVVACNTRCTKPLHHISINPMKDERLPDEQVMAIVQRCEEKYGYKTFHHQRVIVEHVKDGRQHFHVIWNRVSLMTGRPVWPGEHWNKSKQVCREMEKELGLKKPMRKGFKAKSGKLKTKARRVSQTKRKVKTSKTKIGRFSHKSYSRKSRTIKFMGVRIKAPRFWKPLRSYSAKSYRPKSRSFISSDQTIPNKPIVIPTTAPIYVKTTIQPIAPVQPAPFRPIANNQGWPLAAVIDWKMWGNKNPQRFFTKWPELKP